MGAADSELGQEIGYSVRDLHYTPANKCRHTTAYAKLRPDQLLSQLAAALPTFRLTIHRMPLHRAALKVKVTLVQALRFCTGRTAHRGSTGIALPFHDHGTRRGWGVSVTPLQLFTLGKDSVPIVQEAALGPGPVWTMGKISPSLGFDPRTFQPVAQSLYRLSYPAHLKG